jgi:hypothetical protein
VGDEQRTREELMRLRGEVLVKDVYTKGLDGLLGKVV